MTTVKKAFVLVPFKPPYESYYRDVFKPALEAASYEVSRTDDLFTPSPIMTDIQRSIVEADLILCDMSERNPNVFYELGLAHAIGKPAILLAQKEEDIPFDLRHIRVITYDSSIVNWEDRIRQLIISAAQAVETAEKIWPPPLLEAQGNEQEEKNASEVKVRIRNQRTVYLFNREISIDLKRSSIYPFEPIELFVCSPTCISQSFQMRVDDVRLYESTMSIFEIHFVRKRWSVVELAVKRSKKD